MSETLQYDKTHRSTVNRLKQRAVYDQDFIHGIIDATPVLHVSFMPTSADEDPFPTILPMLGCIGTYTSSNSTGSYPAAIYLHGYVSSRLMKLPSSSEDEGLQGTPVCVAASLMDGVVLALTPFNHSCNYRSAVVHGWATVVTDPDEKMYAMELMTNNIVSDRWNNSRVPPTEAELKSTAVLRVEIVSASGKTRVGSAGDDRADMQNEELRQRVWTGVVPSWTTYGDPIPAGTNYVEKVPEYLQKWLHDENAKGEQYAKEAAEKKALKKS
ncbi:hypothetical protein BDQ17DRAFT_1392479 [Cyathus striatus]|nr:hypothetical protein BDQ17DRAFT_1392479 [Cyathus striatus]